MIKTYWHDDLENKMKEIDDGDYVLKSDHDAAMEEVTEKFSLTSGKLVKCLLDKEYLTHKMDSLSCTNAYLSRKLEEQTREHIKSMDSATETMKMMKEKIKDLSRKLEIATKLIDAKDVEITDLKRYIKNMNNQLPSKEDLLNRYEYRKETGELFHNVYVSSAKKGEKAGGISKQGYRVVNYKGRELKIHRIVWFIEKGYWPHMLDHINRIKTDNRIENLRLATSTGSSANRIMPKGKYPRGVRLFYNRWQAAIGGGKKEKKIFIGSFDTMLEAAEAYNKAAKERHGEFAILNDLSSLKEIEAEK